MNQRYQTSSSSTRRAIAANYRIIRKSRDLGVSGEFRLLEACNFDTVLREKIRKLGCRRTKTVTVPDNHAVGRRRARTGVGMDVSYDERDEEEEETEEEEEAPANV